jgi:uncharacterized protein (TIGR02145 family)
VALSDVNEFQLSDESEADDAVGMMVYNTKANTTNGQGVGVYVWDGTKWQFVFVINGSTTASQQVISSVGTYKTSTTGSGEVTGSAGTYKTWCFTGTPGNICWMTENSKEGTSSATTYNNNQYSGRGYYYTWEQAATACPSGWTLPGDTEWNALRDYLNGSPDATFKKAWRLSALAGYYDLSTSRWSNWNSNGRWWSSTSSGRLYYTSGSATGGPNTNANDYFSVRCVKSN